MTEIKGFGKQNPTAPNETSYDRELRLLKEQVKRFQEGRVVVKAKDCPLERTRQGLLRFYLHNLMIHDTVLKDWRVFVHEIHTHSGKHTHQGGLVIFVLDGEGYTLVDREKVEWKKGDLILLPIKPGGVEHQHFNRDPNRPSRWLALIYAPFQDALAHFLDQKEESPSHTDPRQVT